MGRYMKTALIVGFVVGCGSSSSTQDTAVAPAVPDLSGTWVLNADASDDPRAQMEELMAQAGGSRPGGRSGASPGGRKDGRRGGQQPDGEGDGDRREQMRHAMQAALQARSSFTLSQTDAGITFSYGDGSELTLRSDNKKLEQETAWGGEVEIRAKWEGRFLEVERKFDGGTEVTEEYFLSFMTDQLYVVVSLETGRGEPIMFRRVYDPQ